MGTSQGISFESKAAEDRCCPKCGKPYYRGHLSFFAYVFTNKSDDYCQC